MASRRNVYLHSLSEFSELFENNNSPSMGPKISPPLFIYDILFMFKLFFEKEKLEKSFW
jgi:hypothetical protein